MLRGLHDTSVPMIYRRRSAIGASACRSASLLAFHFGLDGIGIWIGLSSGLAVVAVLLLWRWLRRDRVAPLFRHAPR